MRILSLVVITVLCAIIAIGMYSIITRMVPWYVRTWRDIKREEVRQKAAAVRKANVITLYTYNKDKRLVRPGEKRAAR